MVKRIFIIIFCSVSILFASCKYYGAGTHGSIKAYSYPVKKAVLEQAVNKVIANSNSITKIDTTQRNFIIDITHGKHDTIFHKIDKAYVDIIISSGNEVNTYTFQYSGSLEEWDTGRTSDISIAYAHDKSGDGGSEGNGDFPFYKLALKNKLTTIFEKELISKLDEKLGVNHTVEK